MKEITFRNIKSILKSLSCKLKRKISEIKWHSKSLSIWLQFIMVLILLYSNISTIRIMEDQTKIMFNTTANVERPYVWIDVEPEFSKVAVDLHKKYTFMKNLDFEVTLKNEGKTPAIPIYLSITFFNYGQDSINLRNIIIKQDFDYQKYRLYVETGNKPIKARPNLNNFIDNEFTQILFNNHPYTHKIMGKYALSAEQNNFYIHTYFLYKDLYGMYHDFYKVQRVKRIASQKKFTIFRPWADIRKYQNNPIRKKLR